MSEEHRRGPEPARSEEAAPGSPETPDPPPSPEGQNGQRPTPVRMVMEVAEPEEDKDGGPRILNDPSNGVEWVVRISGRSGGGVLPLRTVPLLHLTFSPPEGSALPQRGGVFPGENLLDLEDDELLAHFFASVPLPSPDSNRVRVRDVKNRRGGTKPPRR